MTIEWRKPYRPFRRSSGMVNATAKIYAAGTQFGMEVESPGSDSRTRIARWVDVTVGSPELYYVYDVTPKAGARQGPDPYTGAAILRYYADRDELRGNYWTSQMGVGRFELRRPTPGGHAAAPTAPRPSTKRLPQRVPRRAGLLLVAVMVVAVIAFLVAPHPWQKPQDAMTTDQHAIEFAVDQASRTCLVNLTDREQRSIKAGVTGRLLKYSAGGQATIERTRRSVDETFSEAGQIEEARRLSACLVAQTDKFIAVPGRLAPPSGSDAPKGSASTDPVAVKRGGRNGAARGYVYYEEDDGRLTHDGVFAPLSGPAKSYGDLRSGDVLRSVDQAQLRKGPSDRSQIVKSLLADQCVRIEAGPTDPEVGLTRATSGGRLSVVAVSCP